MHWKEENQSVPPTLKLWNACSSLFFETLGLHTCLWLMKVCTDGRAILIAYTKPVKLSLFIFKIKINIHRCENVLPTPSGSSSKSLRCDILPWRPAVKPMSFHYQTCMANKHLKLDMAKQNIFSSSLPPKSNLFLPHLSKWHIYLPSCLS